MGCVDEAREVFDEMPRERRGGVDGDGGRHAKVWMVGAAREVFDAMGERNVVSWTAMVAGTRVWGMWEAAKAFV
ncbi:hypothetical protein Syun_016609 [Stephania yunnanensis]|uniref:Pentatricopeptide repeat-containing protein n=1 Tax=Stephania yunnanensis TaxID=152371 RepID=A0AAP0J552_9MAGN